MKRRIFVVVLAITAVTALHARAAGQGRSGGIPFTQDDRDRIIRLDVEIKALRQQMRSENRALQQQINDLKVSTQQQINDLRNFLLWGFGILFAGMMTLIGFVLWDRRTALAPAIRNTEEIRQLLREYAKKEPKLAEAMRSLGIF